VVPASVGSHWLKGWQPLLFPAKETSNAEAAACLLGSSHITIVMQPASKCNQMLTGEVRTSQSTMKVKNSSPILRTSNSPARVPMSDSRISSGRCTIVAPVARAMRLLSAKRLPQGVLRFAVARQHCRCRTP